jgi:hypothetical protein
MNIGILATLAGLMSLAPLSQGTSAPIPLYTSNSGRTVSGGSVASDASGMHNSGVVIGQWVPMSANNTDNVWVHTGDLNGDGRVDISDALLSLQSAVGLIHLSDPEILRGDVGPLVNDIPVGDGKINIDDAILILRKAVGLNW